MFGSKARQARAARSFKRGKPVKAQVARRVAAQAAADDVTRGARAAARARARRAS